jgi:hypothetical protein
LAERRLAVGDALRPSLDRLRITHSATERKRVGQTIGSLTSGALPGSEDYETLLYPAGVAWTRQVPGRSLWILYRFDAAEVMALVLVDQRPVRVGD